MVNDDCSRCELLATVSIQLWRTYIILQSRMYVIIIIGTSNHRRRRIRLEAACSSDISSSPSYTRICCGFLCFSDNYTTYIIIIISIILNIVITLLSSCCYRVPYTTSEPQLSLIRTRWYLHRIILLWCWR